MIEILKFNDATEVAEAAADAFVHTLVQLLAEKAEINISVTGGSLGIKTLAAIAEHRDLSSIDFQRVRVWWGDERFVTRESEDRNFNQAFEALFSKVPEAKLHPMPAAKAGLTLQAATEEFAQVVAEHSVDGFIPFDLTLLGMGPDGHIASLFPGKPPVEAGVSVLFEDDSPKPPAQRISFSYEAINHSSEIWFLVAGADKALPVSIATSTDSEKVPAGRVSGIKKTVWFLDQTAASKLS